MVEIFLERIEFIKKDKDVVGEFDVGGFNIIAFSRRGGNDAFGPHVGIGIDDGIARDLMFLAYMVDAGQLVTGLQFPFLNGGVNRQYDLPVF